MCVPASRSSAVNYLTLKISIIAWSSIRDQKLAQGFEKNLEPNFWIQKLGYMTSENIRDEMWISFRVLGQNVCSSPISAPSFENLGAK